MDDADDGRTGDPWYTISSPCQTKIRHLAPLDGCAYGFELKNEFTEDEKYHNLIKWLKLHIPPMTPTGNGIYGIKDKTAHAKHSEQLFPSFVVTRLNLPKRIKLT